MSSVTITVQVFPNLPVEGEGYTATKVVAAADCGDVGFQRERLLDDQVVASMAGISRDSFLAATKRECLRELTIELVAKGLL